MSKGIRVEVSVEADLFAAIDRQISSNARLDRSAVIEDALRLWLGREQDLALERQLRADAVGSRAELDDWRRVRNATGRRRQ